MKIKMRKTENEKTIDTNVLITTIIQYAFILYMHRTLVNSTNHFIEP